MHISLLIDSSRLRIPSFSIAVLYWLSSDVAILKCPHLCIDHCILSIDARLLFPLVLVQPHDRFQRAIAGLPGLSISLLLHSLSSTDALRTTVLKPSPISTTSPELVIHVASSTTLQSFGFLHCSRLKPHSSRLCGRSRSLSTTNRILVEPQRNGCPRCRSDHVAIDGTMCRICSPWSQSAIRARTNIRPSYSSSNRRHCKSPDLDSTIYRAMERQKHRSMRSNHVYQSGKFIHRHQRSDLAKLQLDGLVEWSCLL